MYRREFLKRAAAALAGLMVAWPREPARAFFAAFAKSGHPRPDRYRAVLADLESLGFAMPPRHESVIAAMQKSPEGHMWLGRQARIAWSTRLTPFGVTYVAIDAFNYA